VGILFPKATFSVCYPRVSLQQVKLLELAGFLLGKQLLLACRQP
jgi:hypothetical protein